MTVVRSTAASRRSTITCGATPASTTARGWGALTWPSRGTAQPSKAITIASGAISFEVIPENLPRHPVPVVLLARLAVDRTSQGQGLGAMLLMHALKRVQDVSEHLGVHAVAVDALNESARAFYLKYGFSALLDDPLHLFLSIKKIRHLGL